MITWIYILAYAPIFFSCVFSVIHGGAMNHPHSGNKLSCHTDMFIPGGNLVDSICQKGSIAPYIGPSKVRPCIGIALSICKLSTDKQSFLLSAPVLNTMVATISFHLYQESIRWPKFQCSVDIALVPSPGDFCSGSRIITSPCAGSKFGSFQLKSEWECC